MRARVLVLAAAIAVVAVYLLRDAGSGASDRPAEAPRLVPPPPTLPAPPVVPLRPTRNVFAYADAARPAPAPRPTVVPAPAPLGPAPSPSPAVRLVGLVRRGGQLKAALAIAGETLLLGAGESAAGYTVTSIDEDEGVRVRGPDGVTLQLAPAPE